MITVKDIGKYIKAIEIGNISFVVHNEDLIKDIINKVRKLESFEVESLSRKRIVFRYIHDEEAYEIIDSYLNIIEKIPVKK